MNSESDAFLAYVKSLDNRLLDLNNQMTILAKGFDRLTTLEEKNNALQSSVRALHLRLDNMEKARRPIFTQAQKKFVLTIVTGVLVTVLAAYVTANNPDWFQAEGP